MAAPIRIPVKKTFSISSRDGSGRGEKIILYGESGMGKTTLAGMAPVPVFIGLDDGGEKIRNKNGEALQFVDGVITFEDLRGALRQIDLFTPYNTVVIDTITIVENLSSAWMLTHIPGPSDKAVINIEGYGYNKGYKHLWDTMQLILQDVDSVVRSGRNVVLIAQSKSARVANPGGEDYLCDMPSLYSGTPSIAASFIEWADHVLAVRYNDLKVKAKKVGGGDERAIFTFPTPYFRAKSRTIKEPVISFNSPTDDSIWKFMFGGR